MPRWLGVLALLGHGCAEPPAAVAPAPAHGNPCVRAGRPCTDMYVAAHEDDDLLFMNPDLAASIAAGNRVVVVHVTAGDLPPASVPDFTQYWIDRERGSLNALTAMALGNDASFDRYQPPGDAPAGWTASIATYGGLRAARYDLGAVTAVFLRLSDFQLDPAWHDEPGMGGQLGGAMLPAGDTITLDCLDPTACTLGTVIAAQQLTRDQLIDVLTEVITSFAPDSVSAQDATALTEPGIYWDELGTPGDGYTDYWDHVFGAAFTLTAATRAQAQMTTPLALRLYRDYTISQEPENLGDADALAKVQVFARYAVLDTSIEEPGASFDVVHPRFHGGAYELDTPESWQHRELATRTLLAESPLQGRLAIGDGCVGVANGGVIVGACDGAPSWTVTATNQLASAGQCLSVAGGVVALAPCAPQAAASTLFLFANGQLRGPDATCLADEGGALVAEACDHEPPAPHATGLIPAHQDFTLRFDPPRAIAGAPAGSGLWIAHQHACARTGDGVACAAWTSGQLAGASPIASLPADATDVAAVWDPRQAAVVACARSAGELACGSRTSSDHAADQVVRFVDLAGQGVIDACGTTAHGITCSLDDGAGWAPEKAVSTIPYGKSLLFGDVDGDAQLDACSLTVRGIECASQLPGGFVERMPRGFDEDRSAGVATDFADLADDSSLALVDVNRDGLADACARDAAGVWCAMSTGAAFERRKLVAPGALLDGPIAWGDLDGDVRVDACALGAAGLVCTAGY